MKLEDFVENEYYLWDWSNTQCIMICIKINNILKLKIIKSITNDCEIDSIHDIIPHYDVCRPLTQLEKLKYL